MVAHSPFPASCYAAALWYAQQGLPVFPVQGKIPFAGTRGFSEASTDPHRIRWWWRRWPLANVAVPTGRVSGWAVLDVDERHDGFHSLQRLASLLLAQAGAPLPVTCTTRTGSGYHLIFAQPSPVIRNAVALAGFSGLDLRGEGGYVVVPPSLHPSGWRYRWQRVAPLAPFPPALQDLLSRAAQRGHSLHPDRWAALPGGSDPHRWLERAIARARPGTRHSCALWLAHRLLLQARLSLRQAEGYMSLYVAAIPGGGDDFRLSEALACLRWASTHSCGL